MTDRGSDVRTGPQERPCRPNGRGGVPTLHGAHRPMVAGRGLLAGRRRAVRRRRQGGAGRLRTSRRWSPLRGHVRGCRRRLGRGRSPIEPPARIVLAWKPNDRPEPPTEVEIHFEPDGDGTLVSARAPGLGQARRTGGGGARGSRRRMAAPAGALRRGRGRRIGSGPWRPSSSAHRSRTSPEATAEIAIEGASVGEVLRELERRAPQDRGVGPGRARPGAPARERLRGWRTRQGGRAPSPRTRRCTSSRRYQEVRDDRAVGGYEEGPVRRSRETPGRRSRSRWPRARSPVTWWSSRSAIPGSGRYFASVTSGHYGPRVMHTDDPRASGSPRPRVSRSPKATTGHSNGSGRSGRVRPTGSCTRESRRRRCSPRPTAV